MNNQRQEASMILGKLNTIALLSITITLFAGFMTVGVSPISSIQLTLALMIYSIPFFAFVSRFNLGGSDPIIRAVISFGLGSIALTLLFGFTGVAGAPIFFWILGVSLALTSLVLLQRGAQRAFTPIGISSLKILVPIGITFLLVTFSSFAQRITWPFSQGQPRWLPDDAPIFAEWGRTLALGGFNQEVIDGFILKYHWLSYSLLGGLDHLITGDYMAGSVQVAPVIAWTGLGFGALALSRLLSPSQLASSLSVISVLFASSVGILAFSMVSLGGVVVSPSHLISGFWIIVVVLISHHVLKSPSRPMTYVVLFAFLGFAVALAKFSAFAIMVLCLFAFVLYALIRSGSPRISNVWSFTSVMVAFMFGGLVAYVIFISGSPVPILLEPAFAYDAESQWIPYLIQLLPMGAAFFSLVVLVLPNIAFTGSNWRRDPLYISALILSVFGLIVAVVFEMRDSAETWIFAEALAVALPVSSVLVVRQVTKVSKLFKDRKFLWMTSSVTALLLGALMLRGRENDSFLVRPWLAPTILIMISCFAALVTVFVLRSRLKRSHSGKVTALSVCSITIVTLFLTSLSFGFGLRAVSVVQAMNSSNDFNLARDSWLASAQSLVDSGEFDPNNSSIAVYSTSEGEQTLARWIPYLTGVSAYFIRDDDLLRNIYVSAEGKKMIDREKNVANFIENHSQESCLVLNDDGVRQIWVTPNSNFSESGEFLEYKHKLIDVICS